MASFLHALVSLLVANSTSPAKAMAVRHNLEQHRQLYLGLISMCKLPRFRAIRRA